MFIKEIIIDGFKSYANRTVVSGFDPSFNAITGLNGSGKSNILDSICFVLGITNLSQVRVSNLQELVYKQGQSRVTRASVTIVFDNSEPGAGPSGYEQFEEITVTRQVVIGGRNKYLINGHTAQQSRVRDLFHSVQLNVNNPHFLIMQGRITKVVNMKPHEVLGMLEEAAGTRMYESKKQAALKTIAKKQIKVDEINRILLEDITPTLEKLRKERSAYIKWSNNKSEIERLERLCVAAEFSKSERLMRNGADEIKGMQERLAEMQEEAEELQSSIAEQNEAIDKLESKRASQEQSIYDELEAAVAEQSKSLVKATSKYQNKKEDLDSERAAVRELETSLAESREAVGAKQAEMEAHAEEVSQVKARQAQLSEEISTLQSQQLGFSMGEQGEEQDAQGDEQDEDDGSLASQLMRAQQNVSSIETELQGLDMRDAHLAKTAAEKRKGAKGGPRRAHTALEKKLAKVQAQLEKVNAELEESGLGGDSFDENAKTQLETKVASLRAAVESLREDEDSLRASLSRFEFEYESPGADFDPNAVKGLVAKLITLQDASMTTAIEVAAGSRLYNVVVDTESTGKQLLENGKLKRRVTIIPLNKIARQQIKPAVQKAAKKLVGEDNVSLALSLVGFDDEVERAMQYVFGGTLVCPDSDTARKVTFHPKIKTKSVTQQGDVFDPAGTLTGGSRPSGASVLMRLQRLAKLQAKREAAQEELDASEQTLREMTEREDACREATVQKELLCHELALNQTRLGQTEYARLTAEADALDRQREELAEQRKQLEEARDTRQAKCEELAAAIENLERARAEQMAAIEGKLADAKAALAAHSEQMEAVQGRSSQLSLELESLQEEVTSIEAQIAEKQERVAALEAEAAQLEAEVGELHEQYEAKNGKLERFKEKRAETDRKLKRLAAHRDKLERVLQENALEEKKLTHTVSKSAKELSEARFVVESLLEQHEWIVAERHLFGQRGSDYDFSRSQDVKAARRLAKLREEQEALSRRINKKVMGMFEKAEQEYSDLMRKRDIVLADKAKIEQVISELDQKKNEALESTWAKVNRDFGSIFSTLLPGTEAKLAPPDGMTVLDGLEVRVAFGGEWKESLTELSGGQRSLLALSLVLAMLLFKPAPMYILDEIDAALDLSHTQNIGQMLKTHFPQSQFIVVSLKEGMFNNANVIFRTKFVDGVSTVTRTEHRALSASSSSGAGSSGSSSSKATRKKKTKSKKATGRASRKRRAAAAV